MLTQPVLNWFQDISIFLCNSSFYRLFSRRTIGAKGGTFPLEVAF
jgi:hypothetical protein